MVKNILDTISYQSKVSSVLNKDITQYGKGFMFDGNEETCWCSEQGSPQKIQIKFDTPVNVSLFQMQFQGGFVGKDCEVTVTESETNTRIVEPFYPEDINSLQTFKLSRTYHAQQIVFIFNASSDFFGRIIIYKLSIPDEVS